MKKFIRKNATLIAAVVAAVVVITPVIIMGVIFGLEGAFWTGAAIGNVAGFKVYKSRK